MTVQSWRRVPLCFLSIKTADTTFKIKSCFDSRTGKKFSSHLQNIQISSTAHPTLYSLNTRGSFLGVKRPGREAVWSPLCRFTVTNDSQYVIRSWHVTSRAQWQLRRVANGKYSLEGNDATPATSYISQTMGNVRHGIRTME